MKNLLSLVLLSLILIQPAEASRSRLTALGQNADGSIFIEDQRNIFLNPVWVNKNPNGANFEWGSTNTEDTPKAEGGVRYELGGMNMAIQLGRLGFAAQEIALAGVKGTAGSRYANTATGFYLPENSIEVFFGNTGAMDWGGSVHYSNSSNEISGTGAFPDTEAQVITGKFGIWQESFEGYGHVDLKHESENKSSATVNEKYEGELSFRFGGSFHLSNDSKVGARLAQLTHDFNDGPGGNQGERKKLSAQFDYYKEFKRTESDFLFGTFGLLYLDDKGDFQGGVSVEQDILALPVTIGLEKKAKTWLALRASVTQRVIINKNTTNNAANSETESNGEDDTVVAAGAGFVFDNLSFDATFQGSTNGNFNATNMFGNIGMNYSF